MRIVAVAIISSLLLIGNPVTQACSCVDPDKPLKELKKAKAVFVGEVIEVKELAKPEQLTDDSFLYLVRFKIEKYWKGVRGRYLTVLTDLPLGDCGWLHFEEGKKYLVYAYGNEETRMGFSKRRY
jgi:hypothetical protein